MRKSKNQKVQLFLEDIENTDNRFDILKKLRDLTFENYPNLTERIIYGGIMFSIDSEDFGGIFLYKNHISYEFGNGYLIEDSKGILEGKGKYRRHIKIRVIEDISNKNINLFIKQALK